MQKEFIILSVLACVICVRKTFKNHFHHKCKTNSRLAWISCVCIDPPVFIKHQHILIQIRIQKAWSITWTMCGGSWHDTEYFVIKIQSKNSPCYTQGAHKQMVCHCLPWRQHPKAWAAFFQLWQSQCRNILFYK